MNLLCVYCRRVGVPMVLDPDLVPMVAMCEDCYAARFAVPEPSEGATKLPADHSLCDLPCDLPDEAHDG